MESLGAPTLPTPEKGFKFWKHHWVAKLNVLQRKSMVNSWILFPHVLGSTEDTREDKSDCSHLLGERPQFLESCPRNSKKSSENWQDGLVGKGSRHQDWHSEINPQGPCDLKITRRRTSSLTVKLLSQLSTTNGSLEALGGSTVSANFQAKMETSSDVSSLQPTHMPQPSSAAVPVRSTDFLDGR